MPLSGGARSGFLGRPGRRPRVPCFLPVQHANAWFAWQRRRPFERRNGPAWNASRCARPRRIRRGGFAGPELLTDAMPDLSVEQFQEPEPAIYQKLGLHFDDKKIYFLKTRVAKRMAALGLDDAQEYLFMVSYADPKGREMQALANLVTTNETYMFREYDQLQAFANHCLPEVLSAKQARGEKTLRIWSAGCSSGEEPYTLAMILQEVFPQAQSWDCEIVATDIDENMLRKVVVAARYGCRSVNEVPDEYREKYLIEDGDEYMVRRRTAALVRTRSSQPARPDGHAGHAGL